MEEFPHNLGATAAVIRATGRKVLGISSGQTKEDKETWWWNNEVHKSVDCLRERRWESERTERNRLKYSEIQGRRPRLWPRSGKAKANDESLKG